MNHAHHPSEEEIFAEALRLPTPEGRALYLNHACGNDEPLRRRVEAMLQAHDNPGEVLDNPTAEVSASTISVATGMVPLFVKPGERIGRYRILESIGEGGCGVVYAAEQEQPVRRRVALKVIKLGMDTKQVIARFEAERQVLALMDHPNIAKVLDGVANLDEEVEPFLGAKVGLVAVVGDLDAPHQFHDEVGPTHVGRARIEHLGDVRMIHHGQCLPLGLEPRDDLLGVHAQLDHLEGHFAADRLFLFGDIDHAAAALPDLLQQLVASQRLPNGLIGGVGEVEFDGCFHCGLIDAIGQHLLRLVLRGEQPLQALA